jgi:hypothetical protein
MYFPVCLGQNTRRIHKALHETYFACFRQTLPANSLGYKDLAGSKLSLPGKVAARNANRARAMRGVDKVYRSLL